VRDEATDYLRKELISLLDVMMVATNTLHKEYGVDSGNAFSASSLAMMIFRTRFLNIKNSNGFSLYNIFLEANSNTPPKQSFGYIPLTNKNSN
jgi:hypothetical protein